jgi:hypothetical protein
MAYQTFLYKKLLFLFIVTVITVGVFFAYDSHIVEASGPHECDIVSFTNTSSVYKWQTCYADPDAHNFYYFESASSNWSRSGGLLSNKDYTTVCILDPSGVGTSCKSQFHPACGNCGGAGPSVSCKNTNCTKASLTANTFYVVDYDGDLTAVEAGGPPPPPPPLLEPDLRVTAFNLPNGTPGEVVLASVTVRNFGGGSTGSGFEVAVNRNSSTMNCNSGESGSQNTGVQLGAGLSRDFNNISVTLPASDGVFTATAMVDSDCDISESNEGNNIRNDSYTVASPGVCAQYAGACGGSCGPGKRKYRNNTDGFYGGTNLCGAGVECINDPVCAGPAICGNGVPEAGEACDDGGGNGACPHACSDGSGGQPACTENVCGGDSVSGRVTDQNGIGVAGVGIHVCNYGDVLTDASGSYSQSGIVNPSGICARIDSLPANYGSPNALNARSPECGNETGNGGDNNSYEHQVFGETCPGWPGCLAQNDACDLPTDDNFDYQLVYTPPQCNDGLDNDWDTLEDFPDDPGCVDALDNDEFNPPPPQCNNGIDDDSDGLTDFPDDPGCVNALDNDEFNPPIPGACSDNGSILSTTIPAALTLSPGEVYTFAVDLDNSGTSKWYNNSSYSFYRTDGFALGFDCVPGSITRCTLPIGGVPTTGSFVMNNVEITAPLVDGVHNFKMQMRHTVGWDYQDDAGGVCANPPPGSNVFFGEPLVSTVTVSSAPIPIVEICQDGDLPPGCFAGPYPVPELGSIQFKAWHDPDGVAGPNPFVDATAGATWNACGDGASGPCNNTWFSAPGLFNGQFDGGPWPIEAIVGGTSDIVTVNVLNAPLPEMALRCDGAGAAVCLINFGDPVIIEWCGSGAGRHNCANATSCTVTGNGGPVTALSGEINSPPLVVDTTYTLSCTGPGSNGGPATTQEIKAKIDGGIPECADGINNDPVIEDLDIDFPDDIGCTDIFDDDETNPVCSDGLDNDGDGKFDWPFDPGCSNQFDENESDPSFDEF